MKLQGWLRLKHDNDDYIICNGRASNISDILYSMYIDKAIVDVEIKRSCNNKLLFKATGELYKDKIQPKYYVYYVGDKCLDQALWNLVGERLTINIKRLK